MNQTRYFILNNDDESAFIETPIYDSGLRGNVWQRVLADAIIPNGGSIIWTLYASDNPDDLKKVFSINNLTDFIPQNVKGRYLRLSAQMSGGVKLSLILTYCGWESFLDYLPEIYREYDGFLDRFLRLFSASYLDIEKRIDKLPETFDPRYATDSTLRKLAQIVGVSHVNLWSEDGLRKLLTSGIYSHRGRFSVFNDYIEFFTGFRPNIVENFRAITGNQIIDRLYEGFDITVFLPPEAALAKLDINSINVVIADFLPSGLTFKVVILDILPAVSDYAFIGINSRVGAYEQTTIGSSRIGFSIVGGKNEKCKSISTGEE